MGTILNDIKKILGVSIDDDSFDQDLILYINAVVLILAQLGLEEASGYPVIDPSDTWEDLLEDRTDLEVVKTYIAFKVKLMFDPPTNSAAIQSYNAIISEMEWRINNLQINKGVVSNG